MPRLFCLALLVLLAPAAWAQGMPFEEHQALRATLTPAAQARIVEPGEDVFAFATTRRGTRRTDDASGVVRADFRISAPLTQPDANPEQAARQYLAAHADRYGLAPALADLRTERIVTGAYSRHVVFRQMAGGLPVYARTVQVNLDGGNRVVQVLSGYDPVLRGVEVSPRSRSRTATAADVRALLTGEPARVDVQEEMLTPDGHRVWRVVAVPEDGRVEWELLLDAASGAPAYVFERSTHGLNGTGRGRMDGKGKREDGGLRFRSAGTRPLSPNLQPPTSTDGAGFVFDPDPLTSAGVPYGGAYVDGDDATTPALDAQRVLVTLPEISFAQNRYTLDGPYVRISGEDPSGKTVYTPPSEARPDGFRYTRADDGFEAVMVYYHVDASQRRIQALDVGRPVLEHPVAINPHGYSADDSRFFPSSGRIYFGTGGIDDAEDASVIWHEYAHAILHDGQPALYVATDGTALHEGWADYWAASYRRGLLERGHGAGDWRRLFAWDGNVGCWQGRRLDHTGRWPDAWLYPAHPGCSAPQTLYQKGLLWATTLMEVYDALGHDVTDRLAVASHPFIGVVSGVSAFEMAAEALVSADQALYGGAYRGVLLAVLGGRGYLDPETYGPAVAHTPLGSTEQAGGSRSVEVEARGPGAAIAAVTLLYRYDGGAVQTRALDAQGGDIYTGALPLPAGTATITYAIEARDTRDRVTRLPANPAEMFTFTSGPDVQPPALTHVPRERAPLAAWPLDLRATATDNLGLDTVTVAYTVLDPGGATVATGTFGLHHEASDRYAARWPIDARLLRVGSVVRYRVEARDAAATPNTTVAPADGLFQTTLVAQGVLAAFSFEDDGDRVVGDGAWERGTPAYGLPRARTGSAAWMTTLGGAYPATRSASTLALPPLDLRGDPPTLVFWHWYDLERGGQCQTLCDGAAVEVSVDGGTTWHAAVPEGGYPATVDLANTVLGGRGAWGGYSYGWQRATVPLPAAEDVRVRFVLGTDAGNVYPSRYGYAGWALDDVEITTLPHADAVPPRLEAEPASRRVAAAGSAAVPFAFEARDETGVVRATVRYAYGTGTSTLRDTLRLEQHLDRLDRFSSVLTLPQPARAGDRLAYTLDLADADGNTRRYPAQGAYEVLYRTVAQTDVLAEARPTGRWQDAGATWRVAASAAAPEATRSTLVLPPQDLPANAETVTFTLRHAFHLGTGTGGQVFASADDGATWHLLEPVTGYPARLHLPGDPLDGDEVFAGSDTLESTFDLTPLHGQQVRLRVDFVARRPLAADEFWTVASFTRYADTDDDALDVPRVFALHALQPHPVREHATFAYTLDEDASVTLAVYDVLGRRVAVLLDGRPQQAGTYAQTFDASGLASGVYVLRLHAGGRQQSRQVVVAR